MTSEKPEWFEISEGDAITSESKAKSKKLPIIAVAAVGAIIFGGALFANANDEPSADASSTQISSLATPSTSASAAPSVSGAPTIGSVPQGGAQGGDDGFGHDGDHRGPRPDGDHHDGFRPDGDHHRD